jgi:hypothetical protein
MDFSNDFISLALSGGQSVDVAKRAIIAIQQNGNGALVVLDAKDAKGNNIIVETIVSQSLVKMLLLPTAKDKANK